jgi:hypothetical protein
MSYTRRNSSSINPEGLRVSKPYSIRYIYSGLTAELGPAVAAEVMRQLGPAFDRLMYLDNRIAINKKLLKQRRKQKVANKNTAGSISRIMKGVASLALANGHSHVLNDSWAWTPGRKPQAPGWHPERTV